MSIPTFGRREELGAISRFVGEVAAGRGDVLCIEGEAGIGKTHLLEVITASARASGLEVIEGAARELEREVPFAPVVEALGTKTRKRLTELIPARANPGPELRFKLLEFLLDELESSLLVGPGILVIDDLQWADPSTLLFVGRVLRSLPVLPLGLAVAARPHPARTDVDGIMREVYAAGRLKLTRLPAPDVAALAGRALGAAPGPRLAKILDGAGGNPLYVLEVIEALRPAIEGIDVPGTTNLPASLYEAITRSLGALPEESTAVLRCAAVLGTRFDLDDLALTMDRPSVALLEALEPAMRAGVVQARDGEVVFRHDLVRDALYHNIPDAVRVPMHRDVARRLADAGRPPSAVAPHLLVSAAPGDEGALEWLRAAAREAAPQAPTVAVELLEKARATARADHPDRYALDAELARALLWSGRDGEAEDLARELVRQKRGGASEGPVRLVLLESLFHQARLAACVGEIEPLLADDGVAPVERARILARAAGAHFEAGDLDRAERLCRDALELAERAEDDVARSLSASVWARLASRRNGIPSVPHMERAVELTLAGAGPGAAFEAVTALAHLQARFAGRPEAALRLVAEGMRLAEQGGHAWALPWLHSTAGAVHFHAGRLDEASAAAELALTIEGGRLLVPAILAYLGYIEALRDDLPRAERLLADAERAAARQTDRNLAGDFDVGWARALVDELAGRDEAALDRLERLREEALDASARNLLVEFVWYGLAQVRISTRLGKTQIAAVAARTVSDGLALIRAAFPVEPWAGAFEQLCVGMAERDADALIASRGTLARAGRPLLHATAAEEAGRLLAAQGRREDALPLLEEARITWADAGAARKERHVTAALRALGARPRPRAARGRPARGWESLTPTEGQVATLVTEGLTYRQIADVMFVSRRTVETHVAHIFEKIGVSSRAELAAEALRRSAEPA